ncbi:DUF2516 family protein [Gordonia sp. L191]|uniref:DUF2516 family protein n=1 Tax=Gordonia TaxID=2053 RepID=UPI001AD712F4|nr:MULTISPECIES: DUF2516 family protein [Gordonia]QTI70356.1 DUF2516 family protein [Gordonia polyisoprenivorans]WHU46083.1 DUF2516 family protein [Gordonia sp. L191]
MNFVNVLAAGQNLVLWVLTVVAGVAAIVALVHASMQRKDAFPAVDKQSKVLWVSLLALATLFIWLFQAPTLFYLIGVVALIVYLVDVRPRVDSIQNKHWFRKIR